LNDRENDIYFNHLFFTAIYLMASLSERLFQFLEKQLRRVKAEKSYEAKKSSCFVE